MLATLGTAQQLDNAHVALVLAAIAVAVFWRTIIRVVLAVLVALLVIVLGFMAVGLMHAVHA